MYNEFFHARLLVPTFCGERPNFSSRAHRRAGDYKPRLLQSSNGETNSSSSTGITGAHLPSSVCKSSPPLGDHLALPRIPSLGSSRSLSGTDILLTRRSFTHSPTRLHAINTSQSTRSTMPPTRSPQGWHSSHLPVHLLSVYASASTSRRVLQLASGSPLPTLFGALHKAPKYPPQREGSSLITSVGDAVNACVLRTPLLDALPSFCWRNSVTGQDLVDVVSSVFIWGNFTRVGYSHTAR